MTQIWQTKKLAELFDIKSSKRVHKADWKKVGVPFYRAREVVKLAQNGTVENDLFISEELYNEYTQEKGAPTEGDLIISAVGTLGQCYLVKKSDRFYFKDASVLWFDKNSDVDSRYIEYAFKSDIIMKQVLHKSMGATVGTLTISRAKLIDIPIPPIPEQKRIVAKLDQVFEAIDQAKTNVERNLQNAKELFQSKLSEIFSQKGEGWTEIKLGDLGKVSMCKRIMKHQTSPTGDIPFYKIGTFGKTPNAFIDRDTYQEFKQKYSFPKKGDILISASGTIGRRVVYDGEPAYFQDSNIVWIDNNNALILNEYLYHFYGICDWNPSRGATISRLYNDDLRRIIISFPGIDEQREFVETIEELEKNTHSLINQNKHKLDNLSEMKKSILQKAFNGEL
jgi:type I restriction enzyme, S subunit